MGGTDGVSIEAAKWAGALGVLGFAVRTVAGSGPVDVLVPGLERGVEPAATRRQVEEAIEGADVVVVDNLLSLPLNPGAAASVMDALAGRAAIIRHHDLPWQREDFRDLGRPADDPAWVHVTINEHSRVELASFDIDAVVCRNRFPLDGWGEGARVETRAAHDLEGIVVLHPVRAIARKDVPTALRLAEKLDATYWLTGPAEDGYGPALDEILRDARCRVVRAQVGRAAEAYAASDVVAFPSRIEGFGNPVIESALARRPLAVRRYRAAEELAAFGFRWFEPDDADGVTAFLREGDRTLLDHNEAIARREFGLDRLPAELAAVLDRVL